MVKTGFRLGMYAGAVLSDSHPSLSLPLSLIVNLAHPEPVGLVTDQSLQQGLATQTQSIEEVLSSPVAICVMMRRRCRHINLGSRGPLQYVCMCVCRSA